MPKRPAAVLVIAILHFLVAAWMTCGGIGQLTGAANALGKMGNDPESERLERQMEQAVERSFPAFKMYEKAEAVAGLLLAVVLVVAGVGLILMRAWARVLSYVYALAAILNVIAGSVINIVFVLPPMRASIREMRDLPQQALQVMDVTVTLIVFIVPLIGLIYPVAVLIVMSLSGVRRAFRQQEAVREFRPLGADDRDDDYEPGERWRERDL